MLQTYHATSAAGVANIAPDLAAIFARGQVAHLNIEPAGYTAAQYAAPAQDPLAHAHAATAAAIAGALVAAPHGRMLLTCGAEMNGNWTDWGCLSAADYIALYRGAHEAVTSALARAWPSCAARACWVYGPNSTASANCGSAAKFAFPGVDAVDLLGMSAYRSGTVSVDDAVIAPMSALFDALGWPDAWRRDRFVVLQTGSRDVGDRDVWVGALFSALAADARVAGVIYFDAADWAIGAPSGLTSAIAAAPVADRALDGTFAPYFWDVAYGDPGFGEIQALRDAGVTSGCATSPARYCPDDLLARDDAMTLLARAFPGGSPSLPSGDVVTETDLATAVAALGGAPVGDASAVPATRTRAAVLIAHGAGIVPKPF